MKSLITIPLAALLAACLPHPPPPAAPYRAVGQEPGWTLVIDDREITFIGQDGSLVRQPRPQPIIGVAGEIYRTQRIHVNIVHQPCTDTMSGLAYRDTVQVDVDGRRFTGCGGDTTAPSALVGTSWRVTAINGRTTPSSGQYFLRFQTDGTVGARFGCNSMGGRYTQRGNTVTVGDLASTLMGCPEPAGTFERQGAAVLSRPMNMSWSGGTRLTLSNSAGRIDLQRTF